MSPLFGWLGLLAMAATASCAQVELFVAVEGNDAWSGTRPASTADRRDGPVQSLVRARDLARAVRAAHPGEPTAVTITLRDGYHFLAEPLALGPEDSDTILQGAAGETVVVGSGRAIGGWQKLDDRLWWAPAPGTKQGTWDFRTLSVNGRWCKRSYLPRSGYFEHLSEYKEPWRSTTGGGFGKVPEALRRTMIYKPEDLGDWLSQANAELIIRHSWDMSHARITGNDRQTHTLTLDPLLGYPAGAFGVKKYKLENLREGMHEPGLWFLDRDNDRVVYWPRPGEDMTVARALAPVGTRLIAIGGSEAEPVRKLTIRNLTLADTNVPWRSPGFGAAGIREAALSASAMRASTLDSLRLRNVGGCGIVLSGGGANRISKVEVDHAGAAGIVASGGAAFGVGDDLVIVDSHLHHCGLVYAAACGMQIGNVANALIARNLVHDIGYTGICFDGSMTRPRAINGVIESNRVYRCMTELDDGAAIYVTGQIDGTVIRNNRVHDIERGFGIYPDEQTRQVLIRGNLAYRCVYNVLVHMASDIRFENNVLAFGKQRQVAVARNCKRISFTRNIYLCAREAVFTDPVVAPGEQVTASDQNVYYSAVSDRPRIGKQKWEEWLAAGLDTQSVFADPRFVDAARDDFALRDDSPAFKLGFEQLNLAEVPEPAG